MSNNLTEIAVDSVLSETDLGTVAGGGGKEFLLELAAHAVWSAIEHAVTAVYDWSTKADKPPYTRE